MGRWVRVPGAESLGEGEGRRFVLDDGFEVAIFRKDGQYAALDDTCPHQGASLGEGTLHEGRVICPWHGWMFDVTTGACFRVPGISVRVHPVRFAGGAVEVEIGEDDAAAGQARP